MACLHKWRFSYIGPTPTQSGNAAKGRTWGPSQQQLELVTEYWVDPLSALALDHDLCSSLWLPNLTMCSKATSLLGTSEWCRNFRTASREFSSGSWSEFFSEKASSQETNRYHPTNLICANFCAAESCIPRWETDNIGKRINIAKGIFQPSPQPVLYLCVCVHNWTTWALFIILFMIP